jgi:DMSO reductase anchor subunit
MLRNLRRSWLSREVLFAGLFGLGWLVTVPGIALAGHARPELMGVTAALGLGLVYSMAQVYRLPAVPGWNTWRTNAGFLVSSLLLGLALMAVLLSYEPHVTGRQASSLQWTGTGICIVFCLLLQLALLPRSNRSNDLAQIRKGWIGMAILLEAGLSLAPAARGWVSLLVFLIAIAEETLGRWSFYRARSLAPDRD